MFFQPKVHMIKFFQFLKITFNNPTEKFFEFANAYKYCKWFIFVRICRQKYDETIWLSRNHQTVSKYLRIIKEIWISKMSTIRLEIQQIFHKHSANIPQKDALFLVLFCGLFCSSRRNSHLKIIINMTILSNNWQDAHFLTIISLRDVVKKFTKI